jgi:hypothetical protein
VRHRKSPVRSQSSSIVFGRRSACAITAGVPRSPTSPGFAPESSACGVAVLVRARTPDADRPGGARRPGETTASSARRSEPAGVCLCSGVSGRNDVDDRHVALRFGSSAGGVSRAAGEGCGFRSTPDHGPGGKGQKDRTTMLPGAVVDPLRGHLARVRELHEADLRPWTRDAA